MIDAHGNPTGFTIGAIMGVGIVEAFSLSHAQVLDGSETFLEALAGAAAEQDDIYGVNEASIDPDLGDYDNEGDDGVLSTWNWFNKAELAVQAGYLSFALIANLTNQVISSSGAGANQVLGIDYLHEDSFNVAPKPMVVKMPSKTDQGAVRSLAIGLYRVDFKPITFDGPQYKDGLKVNYNGSAVMSAYDEKGVAFPDGKKRAGRILSYV